MPSPQAAPRWSTSTPDISLDPRVELVPEPADRVAQTIDPRSDGCRTIVLTMDADAPSQTIGTGDASILDGGLDPDWVVPDRGARRFGRETEPTARTADPTPVRRARSSFAQHGFGPAAVEIATPAVSDAATETPLAEVVPFPSPATATGRLAGHRDTATAFARRVSGPIGGDPGRRTVRVSGQPAIPSLPAQGSATTIEPYRYSRRPLERLGDRPDRMALWAVLLGVFLIVVAATSG